MSYNGRLRFTAEYDIGEYKVAPPPSFALVQLVGAYRLHLQYVLDSPPSDRGYYEVLLREVSHCYGSNFIAYIPLQRETTHVGLDPQLNNFVLSISTCWYLKSLVEPTRPPSQPNAGQWNKLRVGLL